MNYTTDPSMVRVDFFKDSCKWYTTESMKWLLWGNESLLNPGTSYIYSTPRMQNENAIYLDLNDIFALSLYEHLRSERLSDMIAICLAPYHMNAYPLMMHSWNKKAKILWDKYSIQLTPIMRPVVF